jgi:hypothetical protein
MNAIVFLPRFTGEGDREAVEGAAVTANALPRRRHPFRLGADAPIHLPRKAGEEN